MPVTSSTSSQLVLPWPCSRTHASASRRTLAPRMPPFTARSTDCPGRGYSTRHARARPRLQVFLHGRSLMRRSSGRRGACINTRAVRHTYGARARWGRGGNLVGMSSRALREKGMVIKFGRRGAGQIFSAARTRDLLFHWCSPVSAKKFYLYSISPSNGSMACLNLPNRAYGRCRPPLTPAFCRHGLSEY